MDDATRRRIEEYVRPLAAGLDGITHFGDIRRVVSACERIARDRTDLDRDLLYLLAVFSGQERWVARMGNASRTEILLSSLEVPARTIRALFAGLARLAAAPARPEEEIVHDALLLERMGAYGIARVIAEGRRESWDLPEIAAAVEEAAALRLRTSEADELSRPRREAMLSFARRLRSEYDEFR